jgi:hypothetical protein
VLETGDLAAQLGTGEALIALHLEHIKRVSIEQIWHRPGSSVDHLTAPESENPVKKRAAQASIAAEAIQSASSTAAWGTPLT